MAGTFDEQMRVLAEQIGSGDLVGSVVVDQVYAKYQHENLALNHPRGGGARYLGGPLSLHYADYVQHYADEVLDEHGGNGREAMKDNMEALSAEVATHAPVEFTSLRKSGHPSVTDDGEEYYDRPPLQHRLTEEEIRAMRAEHSTGWKTINGHPVYVGGGDH